MNNIVESYFKAWKKYDLKLLEKIFEQDANYFIENKSFGYNGIKQITDYWIKNSHRQRNLKLEWKIILDKKDAVKVYFNAKFYDTEEAEFNNISGYIDFFINNKDKIYKLSEFYTKETKKTKEYE